MAIDFNIASNQRFYINLLIAIGLISIPIISSPDIGTGLDLFKMAPFQRNFLSYLLLTLFFFVSYYYIIPSFYITKKWFILFFSIILGYIVTIKIPSYIISDVHTPHFLNMIRYPKQTQSLFFSIENHIFQFLVVFSLSLLLRVNEHLNTIKNDKLLTEISYLKTQINPHFLFNTLNSLYVLVLTKSDKAPEAILKLSDLMRYVITESSQNYVDLEKEINYIKDFVHLQELRLTEHTKLITNFKGNFANHQITPLLLIYIIENAFKYGSDTENYSEIVLNLSFKNSTLFLDIKNKILNNNNFSTQKGTNITKKQLEIFYPQKHKLTIKNDGTHYNVILEMELK